MLVLGAGSLFDFVTDCAEEEFIRAGLALAAGWKSGVLPGDALVFRRRFRRCLQFLRASLHIVTSLITVCAFCDASARM